MFFLHQMCIFNSPFPLIALRGTSFAKKQAREQTTELRSSIYSLLARLSAHRLCQLRLFRYHSLRSFLMPIISIDNTLHYLLQPLFHSLSSAFLRSISASLNLSNTLVPSLYLISSQNSSNLALLPLVSLLNSLSINS